MRGEGQQSEKQVSVCVVSCVYVVCYELVQCVKCIRVCVCVCVFFLVVGGVFRKKNGQRTNSMRAKVTPS